MHDNSIQHWEIKSLITLGNMFFRLNTIKLINNKYETAFIESTSALQIANQYIHFYNQHTTENEAVEFNRTMTQRINDLNRTIAFKSLDDVLDTITKEIPEMNRYTKSVPYSYPEDIFGETYR